MNCKDKECLFNSNNGCRLEFCFFDDTEWRLEQPKVKVKCILCDKDFEIDSKSVQRICPECISKLKTLLQQE